LRRQKSTEKVSKSQTLLEVSNLHHWCNAIMGSYLKTKIHEWYFLPNVFIQSSQSWKLSPNLKKIYFTISISDLNVLFQNTGVMKILLLTIFFKKNVSFLFFFLSYYKILLHYCSLPVLPVIRIFHFYITGNEIM
jgi:hypothetical protein